MSYAYLLSEKDSMEESVECARLFLLDSRKATSEEKSKQTAVWERIFEKLLETDMTRFSIKNVSDIIDGKGYRSNKLSDRKPHLDYVAKEAMNLMFTIEQLNDDKYIRSHKEKALRALSFYHGLCETYDTHKHYYLTQADKDTRVFMYVIAGITTYTEMLYAKFCDKLYQCTG